MIVNKNKKNEEKLPLQLFYGKGFLYEIYPSFWAPCWGTKPMLGTVRADDEYLAKYAAYDKGLLIPNATFKPDPVRVTGNKHEKTHTKQKYRKTKNENSN